MSAYRCGSPPALRSASSLAIRPLRLAIGRTVGALRGVGVEVAVLLDLGHAGQVGVGRQLARVDLAAEAAEHPCGAGAGDVPEHERALQAVGAARPAESGL